MTKALIVVLALVGCEHSENRYARREIKPHELVGRWMLTPFGLKSITDVGVQTHLAREEHVLRLRADRTCAVRTVFGLPGEQTDYREYKARCTWHLGNVGHQALQLHVSPEPQGGSPYFYFAEEQGQLIIWQYASDPEAWRYLEFERAGEQADEADGA